MTATAARDSCVPGDEDGAQAPALDRLRATGATGAAELRVPALDGVRGLAIALVLFHTFAGIADTGGGFAVDALRAVALAGWSGVTLFFVLSGFLITGILLDSRGGAARAGYYRRFYLRRTLRIFPLYYAILFAWLVVVPVLARAPALGIQAKAHGIWYWLYLSNWVNPFGIGVDGLGHFWSLAVEEQFYLVWPLLVAMLAWRRLGALCSILLVVTPMFRFFLIATDAPVLAPYEFLTARWDALAAGALLALAFRDDEWRALANVLMPRLTIAALAGTALLLATTKSLGPSIPAVVVVGQSLVIALSAVLVHSAASIPASHASRNEAHDRDRPRMTGVGRLLHTRALRFLGKYSYGIYVFHLPIHFIVMGRIAPFVTRGGTGASFVRLSLYIVGASLASIAAALTSWRLLEAPCLALKERLAPRSIGAAR